MFFLENKMLKRLKKGDNLISLIETLEKSLHQLEENIVQSQQIANFGSWTYDIEKDIFFLSDHVYVILEQSLEHLKSRLDDCRLNIHPEDEEIVKIATQKTLEGKEYDLEYRIVMSESNEKYIHEKTKVIKDQMGVPVKVIGIVQDITEYKSMKKNIDIVLESLNSSQLVTGVGFWKYDVSEKKLYNFNEIYRLLDGNTTSRNHNIRSLLRLVHIEDRPKLKELMKTALTGVSVEAEVRIPWDGGETKFLIGNGNPVIDKNRNITAIMGTVQDITRVKLLEQKLEKSYELLDKAQSLSHIGTWELDIVNNYGEWSDEVYRIYGFSIDQHDNTLKGFFENVHPEDVRIIENLLKSPPKGLFEKEFRIVRPDGSIRHVYEQMEFTFDKEGTPIHVRGNIQDITEKKELQKSIDIKRKEIESMRKKFESIVEESEDGFGTISANGTIEYINLGAKKIIGYSPEDLVGKKIDCLYEENRKKDISDFLKSILCEPSKVVKKNLAFKKKSGKEVMLEVSFKNMIEDHYVHGIVVNFRDITARVEMAKKIEYIATHDELTGLPNSVRFKNQLKVDFQKFKGSKSRFALLILDIEGFKYINDALGLRTGDQLIVKIAERLKKLLGDSMFISRYMGAQFAIIAEDLIALTEYESIAKNIVDLFSEPFKIDIYELDVSVSVGISIFKEDLTKKENPLEFDSLIRQANAALFWARNEGRNKYKLYSSEVDIQSYKQFSLRNDLCKALEENQFTLHYQPIVNLKNDEILGAEALVRWNHPDWGMVSPSEFIYLAEETGFIIDMGKWILREVCKTYRRWLNNGMSAIKISVNFSGIQFLEEDFIENIKTTIDEFELDPRFLIMEITESVLIKKAEKIISDLKKLQVFGIQIALDDFGTGFSSLSYLNHFYFDLLKIDRSFIKDITTNETSNTISKTVIGLGRELKIKLVAEGIESLEQLSCLRDLNCYSGQGFLYSKPIPASDFEKILSKGKCRPDSFNDSLTKHREEIYKFSRVTFDHLLEALMTVAEINGQTMSVGDTEILIKNIDPEGITFMYNMKLPVKRDTILKIKSNLLEKKLNLVGYLVYMNEAERGLYEYGLEFIMDEKERIDLIKLLNQVQIKAKKNMLFAEGDFVSMSSRQYFKQDLS